MYKLLQHEFRKIFTRKEFFIALTFILILAVLGVVEQCLKFYGAVNFTVPPASQLAMIFDGVVGQAVIYCLLPIFSCIACADTYYVESASGVKTFILARCERHKYIMSKAIAIFVVSFLITSAPFLVNQLLCLTAFPLHSVSSVTNWPSYKNIQSVYGEIAVFPVIFMNYPYFNNFLHILLIGVFGSGMGIFSFVLTLFIRKSRLIAVAASSVISLVLIFVIENIGLNAFMPQRYLEALPPILGLNILYFFFGIACIFTISIIGIFYKLRRIKDEL